MSSPVRYRSEEEDSGRWLGFPFRSGDIVISTRSKSGTTWVQMICALLVFQTPDLPAPPRRPAPSPAPAKAAPPDPDDPEARPNLPDASEPSELRIPEEWLKPERTE